MIVHFGLHFDGLQPVVPATAVGEATLGPTRFLNLLETQLGLPPVFTQPGEALLAYQGCLADSDNDSRFYHRSFQVDPISVTRTLFDWRDQWYEAGWQGSFRSRVSRRLSDLADAERLAPARVPLCHGQRLQRVEAAIKAGLATQIEGIVVHDNCDEFPAAWQAVLAHFRFEVAPGVNARGNAQPGTDLGTVQSALLELAQGGEGKRRERQALNADGSLVVVRAISRDLSAQALAEYVLKTQSLDDTVIIAERDGIIVDNALERVGLARAGYQHYSRFRAVTQALKLCLGLVWEPIDPHLLLQFLLHPVAPLPGHVRSTLAEAVANEPGIGGHAWHQALRAITERERARKRADAAKIDELRKDIDYWLACDRYAAELGAPLDVVIERTQRCTTWLARRLHTLGANGGEAYLFGAAQAQGEALIAVLARLKERGQTHVNRIALAQLVDEVSSRAPDPGTFAQAGHVRAATSPAVITQPWDTVIWWDVASEAYRARYPWSDAEVRELRAHGVALRSMDDRVRARTLGWLRPILNARSRLILVVHDREEAHHPLWSRMTSLFRNFNQIRIERALLESGGETTIPALEIDTDHLPLGRLPVPRRWWVLPADCRLEPRPQESYSSLQQLIYHPHQWVLRYPARLRTGRAEDLATGPLLYGNLAHRLFDTFFGRHPGWATLDNAAVEHWLSAYLPQLIAQEGAVLMQSGMGVDREAVLAILEHALGRLLRHLRQAGIGSVRAEYRTDAPFGGIRIGGAIDLLLRDARDREIVLDVKWGRQNYREDELAENRHLQLATYAYLRKTRGGARPWPHQAYFIVSTGNILAHDTSVFPEAIECAPQTGEGVEGLWSRLSETVDWRWRQLAAGDIEVNVAGTEPDEHSVHPDRGLDTGVEPDRFDAFTRLTGWKDGA